MRNSSFATQADRTPVCGVRSLGLLGSILRKHELCRTECKVFWIVAAAVNRSPPQAPELPPRRRPHAHDRHGRARPGHLCPANARAPHPHRGQPAPVPITQASPAPVPAFSPAASLRSNAASASNPATASAICGGRNSAKNAGASPCSAITGSFTATSVNPAASSKHDSHGRGDRAPPPPARTTAPSPASVARRGRPACGSSSPGAPRPETRARCPPTRSPPAARSRCAAAEPARPPSPKPAMAEPCRSPAPCCGMGSKRPPTLYVASEVGRRAHAKRHEALVTPTPVSSPGSAERRRRVSATAATAALRRRRRLSFAGQHAGEHLAWRCSSARCRVPAR